MSEPRRCQLTAVTAKDKSKISLKTVRICLKLDEPTDIANPEFSYLDLIEPKDVEKLDENDPFAAEDKKEMEEMQKIADKLEAKYGKENKKSFKRKRNIKDLIDIGEGYCEDSFVDNSEAYDEVVPWCLDTEHGGFYINEGFLDFIKNDDSHEQEEEEDDFQPKKKKTKLFETGEKHKKKSKLFSSVDGKRPRLKKKLDKQKINTNPPQLTNGLEPKRLSTVTCSTSDTAAANPNVSQQQHEKPGSITATPSKETANNSTNNCQSFVEADQGINELDESFSKCDEINKDDPTIGVMIEDLTSEIVGIVNRTKLQSGSSEEFQPPQIFTAHLLELLTRLHSLCQTRSSEDKHSVFEKLAFVCGIQKELLYKKIKKFRMNLISEQINKCKLELKEAVTMEMPSMIEKYKHDLEESNKLKSEQKESMMTTTSTVKESGESEAEDEGKGVTEAEKLEKVKRIMAPRRKFLWTLEIRKLLCGVVDLKMRHFEMAKIKSQTAEEHLRNFLDSDIKPIWPTGWMQARALFKESRPAHQNWTGELVKQKKIISGINSAVGPQKPSNPQLPQQPVQVQLLQHHQQLQTSSVNNKTQTTTPSVPKAVEEPIVINLDESDNESSKVPAPNTQDKQNQQQQNLPQKNVFTILKEKPVADSGIAPEFTGTELNSSKFLDDIPVNMTSQRNQKTKELRIDEPVIHSSSNNTSIVPTSQQQIPHQISREYSGSTQKNSSTIVQEPAVVAAPAAKSCNASVVQVHEQKEQPKPEVVFYGKIVHSQNVAMPTNSVKVKGHQPNPNPSGDNFGSAISGFQAVTSNSETSPKQHQQRKRTNSYSPTFGTPILSKSHLFEVDTPPMPSSAGGNTNNLSGGKTSQFVETSPVTPKQKNTTVDIQKNLNVVWDTSNNLRAQQQPSSVSQQQQLYQQQLIQQKYQQYQQQQQKQQQMIRKSPKHDKTNISASQTNFPSFQQQTQSSIVASGCGTSNQVMAPVTTKQQSQKDTTLVSGMSKLPSTAGKDQPFSLGQQQHGMDAAIQRAFQSSASYTLTQNDHKLIRDVIVSSQKSPVRKETVVLQQKQSSFGIPQQAFRSQQQLQIIAAAAAQQKLQQNVQLPQQIPQQLNQQQFTQHFFQNPHFSQDNNTTSQHKK